MELSIKILLFLNYEIKYNLIFEIEILNFDKFTIWTHGKRWAEKRFVRCYGQKKERVPP